MQEFDQRYFRQYGFMPVNHGESLHLAYGTLESVYANKPERSSVLFSIFEQNAKKVELIVTPSLLDMPVEPPFMITLSNPQDIRDLFDGHRHLADTLDFPHGRIAQYLALRYLNRKHGERLDTELIGYLARSELSYLNKVAAILNAEEV